jgi:hypothetical protein
MSEKKKSHWVNNNYNCKGWSKEKRQDAYNSFCEHIAEGKDQRSWHYDVDGDTLTYVTMLTWLKENPDEFNPLKKSIAESISYGKWEAIVTESAKGQNTKANVATLQMVMRNKFGWDRRKEDQEQPADQLQAFKEVMAVLAYRQGSVISFNNLNPAELPLSNNPVELPLNQNQALPEES